ncbi:phosphatidate cytidylyltransferase [Blastococcus sp. TF02A-35]|uniref:phosphatidate cytidylyltransferase n=1 Tax=Blastococcus sp. TF02A-35 TaxID=2559612 RepID=UPI001073991C|nr:phosphatidate cytidylyltransferase [Blastococcus sp. TF02A_35]TFV47169.1 phosphatidate cytidylyltransferase [Blastococcus sp. TF02A_35]
MTTPSADRPGSVRPGAEPFPRLGTRRARPADGDTGPVPAVRPAPPLPPLPPRPGTPAANETAVLPDDTAAFVTAHPDAEEPEQPAPVAAKATGRAGRDLRAAIGVGLGLAAAIVASLLVWRPAFLAVLAAAVLVAVVELTRALRAGQFHPPLVPLLVGTVAMGALAWTRGPTGLMTGFFLTALAVVAWRLADGPAGYRRDAAAGVLTALYVPLLAGFAVLLLVPEDGAARVLVFIATVVCSDVGGYAAGVLFGKHPMAPSISPKKSWEGFAGSVLACVLLGTLVLTLTFHAPWWTGVVFGVAIAATATIGDLAESLIKRDLGIKDMGTILPGHGGIMDRLDSLLPCAALSYLLLSVFAPV